MKIVNSDCLEYLKQMTDNSIDAIVTDPPYGLSFMGKKWDYDVPSQEIWEECLRVLKPGGYLLSFAGTRTQHRMAVRIEDAGFEIRDMIFYTYGSGFPKSTNIYKQLKKKCTCGNMELYEQDRNIQRIPSEQETEHNLRPVSETNISQEINTEQKQGEVLQSGLSEQSLSLSGNTTSNDGSEQSSMERGSNTKENSRELSGDNLSEMSKGISTDGEERRIHNATQISDGSTLEQIIDQNGSSTSLRPQSEKQQYREPCAFCKQYGTQAMGAFGFGSALKPACEPITVARKPISEKNLADNYLKWGVGGINIDECRVETNEDQRRPSRGGNNGLNGTQTFKIRERKVEDQVQHTGRFPANLIHDGSDEVVGLFPQTKTGSIKPYISKDEGIFGTMKGKEHYNSHQGDSGSAARFFYCAKSSRRERNMGCEDMEDKVGGGMAGTQDQTLLTGSGNVRNNVMKNNHPTVKPIALMEYLVKLVSKEGHTVLDPFMGSGSTGIACKKLGREFIGIERESDYCKIAEARIGAVQPVQEELI